MAGRDGPQWVEVSAHLAAFNKQLGKFGQWLCNKGFFGYDVEALGVRAYLWRVDIRSGERSWVFFFNGNMLIEYVIPNNTIEWSLSSFLL